LQILAHLQYLHYLENQQADWDDRPSIHANTHLPYVKQKDNIALVMYRPEKNLELFGYDSVEKLYVSLALEKSSFC
jgi:hypothetical protein